MTSGRRIRKAKTIVCGGERTAPPGELEVVLDLLGVDEPRYWIVDTETDANLREATAAEADEIRRGANFSGVATILLEGEPRFVTLRPVIGPRPRETPASTAEAWADRVPHPRHCDDCIHDLSLPTCLRVWLLVHRLPATDGALLRQAGLWPRLYADHRGRRVRVTMASRFGDLGISLDLAREDGYEERGVAVDDLANVGAEP